MTPGESVGTCLRQYSNFRGRATRSEYWWFVLFTWLVTIVVGLASDTAGALALAALLFPCAAAGIRRLHDTARTGWLILLGGIPLANRRNPALSESSSLARRQNNRVSADALALVSQWLERFWNRN